MLHSRFFLSTKRYSLSWKRLSNYCATTATNTIGSPTTLPFYQSVDKELAAGITTSLQAHERLHHLINTGDKLYDKTHVEWHSIKTECNQLLESLKHFKSIIEGTQWTFQPIVLSQDHLADLESSLTLALSNTNNQTKTMLADRIHSLFKGQVKRVLYACILKCPWYHYIKNTLLATCDTKEPVFYLNDILYVIYVSNDEHFHSVAPQHEKDKFDKFNKPPLFACEMRHFISQLHDSNVRAIEALKCPPEDIIIRSPEIDYLSNTLIESSSLLNRNFVLRSLGQAINDTTVRKGASRRKKKISNSPLILKDDLSLKKICESLKLLSYAQIVINNEPFSSCHNIGKNEEEQEIINLLTSEGGIHTTRNKNKLEEYLIDINNRVTGKINEISKKTFDVNCKLSNWMIKTRNNGVDYSVPVATTTCNSDPFREFLDLHNLSFLHSRDLVMITKGGSHMYNLATPTSDVDYMIIYKHPIESILGTFNNLKGYVGNHGSDVTTETAAYECQIYCEMLMKGAVNMFELLYTSDVYYSSPYWEQLISHRHRLISEKIIEQYIGLVESNMRHIAFERYIDDPSKEYKVFYQIFHKLLSLESFALGGLPVVWCNEGKERDFIMNIRQGQDMDRSLLYSQVEEKLAQVKYRLRQRKERFPELTDHSTLQSWLLTVRGITKL